MKKLYSNIGDKVCKVAIICGGIGIACTCIGILTTLIAFANGESDMLIVGPVAAVLGVICLISSWPLYAFGQVTNDVHAIRTSTTEQPLTAKFSDLPDL